MFDPPPGGWESVSLIRCAAGQRDVDAQDRPQVDSFLAGICGESYALDDPTRF